VTQSLARFKKGLGPGDRSRLDEYETDIRELERRLDLARKAVGTVSAEGVVIPAGVPESFDEHVKLHFDLQALAFQADITRVSTVLCMRDLTARSYPESGVNGGFHGLCTTPRTRTPSPPTRKSTSITSSVWILRRQKKT
jgi:hypothetical protein